MHSKTKSQTKTAGAIAVLKFIKSLFISLITTFGLIIIFALLLKWVDIPDSFIVPVNLVIKAISVLLGALSLTKNGRRGIVNGMLFALVYTLVSFTIFSLLAKNFSLTLGLVADFGFNAVVGMIGGIIGVNLKKNK